MDKERIQELMQLSVAGELTDKQSAELERLIAESDELRQEYSELRKLAKIIADNRPDAPDEDFLIHSRQKLMRAIRTEAGSEPKLSLWEKLQNIFTTPYRFAAGFALALILGIFIGQYFLPANSISPGERNIVDVDEFTRQNIKIKNVRFVENYSGNGDVEIVFDAVRPVRYKGNIKDASVQRILASALVSGNNPGSKIRAINRIGEQSIISEDFVPDRTVREALVYSLKNDQNPGVRRQALNVLLNYPLDQYIRDAFLYVLANDNNAGLRVAAINALAEYMNSANQLDNKTKSVLNSKAQLDDNNFIRMRAASLLLEEE